MAIYSLNLGLISRSAGRSAVGFSAYISGIKAQDVRTGVSYNYDCRNDVVVSRILAPEGAPEWAKIPATLWNAVEQSEDHFAALRFRGDAHDVEKNAKSLLAKEQFLNSAQTAQTIMGAIPIEFTQSEAEACVEEFLKERFVARGLVVEYAIHWDTGNPHFHGLITRRPLVEREGPEDTSDKVFSHRKDRDIVTKAELLITRKQWEVVANKHLALGGHAVRIDSRSYVNQGLSFLPTHHEGWYAQRLAEKGGYSRIVADNEVIRQKNIEILYKNPESLIHEVALKRTVFTRTHLEEEIIRRVGGDEKLFSLLKAKVDGLEIPAELILKQANDNRQLLAEGITELRTLAGQFTDQLLSNEEIAHRVGENLNRDPVFTSTAYKKQEEQILSFGEDLFKRQSKSVSDDVVENAIQNRETELGFKLSDEQRFAIQHLCSGSDLRILNGKAGTGKTTLLKAVSEAYQEAGHRVLGTSFQGKAVEIMEKEIGIPCKTLDSFKYAWEKHQRYSDLLESRKLWGRPHAYALKTVAELSTNRLTDKDVVIVDEANMVGNPLWSVFLKEATDKGAKVLIVQDPAQIKSREPGDTGRLFAERFGFAETREVVRQRIPWQRECSKLLNDHQVLDGLKLYDKKGHIHWGETEEQSFKNLTQDYVKDLVENPHQTRIALAYKNADVYALNQSIRDALKKDGNLTENFKIGREEYALGDQIRFTQNDHHGQYVQNLSENPFVGVKNGTFGTIESYDEEKSLLTVCLEDKRRIQFNTKDYTNITYGYALGVHKSEGSTFDRSFVMPDPLMDPSTILVSMTRHREDVQIYVNREQFIDFKALVDRIAKPTLNQTVQDYHVSEDQKPFFERVQQYRDLIVEAATLREEMDSEQDHSIPLYKNPAHSTYQAFFEEKSRVAAEILNNWQAHAPYVRLAGIRKDILEVEAGLRPRLLSDLEHRASIHVQGYMDLVRETRSLWNTISQTHPGALATSHALYEEYQSQKSERDSIASIMNETPKLYAPFFKVTRDDTTHTLTDYWGEVVEKDNRVYFRAVKDHANAHHRSQLQSLFYERLSQEQKSHYDDVKTYVQARNAAAAIYSHLKKEGGANTTAHNNSFSLETFHLHQTKRDAAALKLVDFPAQYQEFFPLLNVKEDKLLEHAVAGELREKIHAYGEEQDIACRADKAQELKRLLTTQTDYRIFNEMTKTMAGVDIHRLSFDIAFYDKLKSGDISTTLSPDDVYKPIQDYLTAAKEAAKAWKTVQVKGPEDTHSQKVWSTALQARNENAQTLRNNQYAFGVVGGMDFGLQQRVDQQAKQGDNHFEKEHHTDNHFDKPFVSVDHVLDASQGHTAEIAMDLLGSPNKRLSSQHALRFGNKGSLVVNISGSKTGLWKDFESGEGGNILQLIGREKGLDFKGSVSYLSDRLSIRPLKEDSLKEPSLKEASFQVQAKDKPIYDQRSKQRGEKNRHTPSPGEQKQTAKEIAARLNAVSELHMKSTPLEGTVAETYLRQERGIKDQLPQDLRYLPKSTTFMYQDEWKTLPHSCLAVFGRTAEGRLSSVQLTKLTEQGQRALNSDGQKLNKIHYGIAKGSFVCVQEDIPHNRVSSRVFIAEGVETALSLKEAGISGKVVASLGIHNIASYQGPEKEVILCGDNDEHKKNLSKSFTGENSDGLIKESPTHALLEKTEKYFKDQGKITSIIRPTDPGDDFNDVLKKKGVKAVQDYLKPYLDPEKSIASSVRDDLSQEYSFSGKPAGIETGLSETHALTRSSPSYHAPTKDGDFKGYDSTYSSPSVHASGTPSSSANAHVVEKEHSLDLISDYIKAKLHDIHAYEGTSLAHEAKNELHAYLTTLEKNETLFDSLKEHNVGLTQELKQVFRVQEQQKENLDRDLHIKHHGLSR